MTTAIVEPLVHPKDDLLSQTQDSPLKAPEDFQIAFHECLHDTTNFFPNPLLVAREELLPATSQSALFTSLMKSCFLPLLQPRLKALELSSSAARAGYLDQLQTRMKTSSESLLDHRLQLGTHRGGVYTGLSINPSLAETY